MEINEILNLDYSQLIGICEKHIDWSKANNRVSGNPQVFTEPGTVNFIGIDCDTNGDPNDDEIEFNLGRYKDKLLVIYNNTDGSSYNTALISCTVDPNHGQVERSHVMPGAYDVYQIGIHGVSSGRTTTPVPGHGNVTRWAVRQDRGKIYVARTKPDGKVDHYEWRMAYSNIHDPNIFLDPGIACTVIMTVLLWFDVLLQYLYDLENDKPIPVNWSKITYLFMNWKQLEGYVNDVVEREELATAENGYNERKGIAMPATKSK